MDMAYHNKCVVCVILRTEFVFYVMFNKWAASLKHEVQLSVSDLIKHELQIYWMASKSSDVDQLILAFIFRFGVILV